VGNLAIKKLPPLRSRCFTVSLINNRYDGNAIGSFIKDTIQAHNHIMFTAGAIAGSLYADPRYLAKLSTDSNITPINCLTRETGDKETAPASLSVLYCVTY
jgi:hypothetical protein